MLRLLARLGRETPTAWWIVLLTVGPILGSFITEPAAMTICAMLLSRKFYALKPGPMLGYATLGLLFVAVSCSASAPVRGHSTDVPQSHPCAGWRQRPRHEWSGLRAAGPGTGRLR
jgi:hypothetical protein